MNINTTNLQLRHLATFVVTAEELHFTRAAARLHMAQQTLSQQIRQLEVELGLPLFDRTRRNVELTEAGKVFYERCRQIIDSFEAACVEAERANSRVRETIFLAFTPSFLEQATKLRMAVVARHPSVKFSLVECWTEQAIYGTRNGTYHGAIVNAAVDAEGLARRPVAPTNMGIVLGKSDPLAESAIVRRTDLLDRKLAVWSRELSPHMYESIADLFKEHFARGQVHEFENLSRGLFLDDPETSELIASSQAFMPAPRSHIPPTDTRFVWRPVEQPNEVAAQLVHRIDIADSPGAAWLRDAMDGALSP